jgi:hypothetical protein
MQQRSGFDQFMDLFLLRVQAPEGHEDRPYYTTGSIVFAALVRVTIIGVVTLILSERMSSDTIWYVALFAIWLVGVWPAHLQYQRFNAHVKTLQTGTLCGACRHFNPTNQLCTIMDVHVTSEAPPCEGEAWEPLQH